jgi:cation:H+ antiporter
MSHGFAPPKHPGRVAALYLSFIALGTFGAAAVNRVHLSPGWAALCCFSAVIFASLAISWGAEAAQFYVSQGFAVAGVALLQVMPEFMVEAVIAWSGQVDLMFANATGSNRLLIGLGWPFIYAVAAVSAKGKPWPKAIELRAENITEVLALLASSSYYLVILAKGSLAWYDALVLLSLFVAYFWALGRLPAEEEEDSDELLAPPRFILTRPTRAGRVGWLAALIVFGGGVLVAVAEPFVHSLQEVAVGLGISVFVFVQWVAPFLSEFPEKVTAFYWARTVRLAPMAVMNMVSSTVSQFTLLVAMIPLVYGLSPASQGLLASVQMDGGHQREIFLSWAMTLYGVACLLKLRFTRGNALVLFALWLVQFLYRGDLPFEIPLLGHHVHTVLAWTLIAASVVEVALSWKGLRVRQSAAHAWKLITHRT